MRRALIDEVIEQRAIRTVFQPVVHLATGTVAGFEALTRGPAGSDLESPMALLDAARLVGRTGDLDWLCRLSAMQAAAAAGLPSTLAWLVNVEPAGLTMPCPAPLLAAFETAQDGLRVILEVVERDMEGNVLELVLATDQARRDAWGVALDDVGAVESSLALLPFLRPDVVKLDMSLVRRPPDAATAVITAGVQSYAERTGAVILAEGIETPEQARMAVMLGATYGQGYYYGRPGPLPVEVSPPPEPIPVVQHLPPMDGSTPYEILLTTLTPRRETKDRLLYISTHLETEAALGSGASVLLAGFQDASHFSPRKQARYRELSRDNALTIVLAQDLPVQDGRNFHVGPLPPGSRLDAEWVVIVLNLHFAAAFVARDLGDNGPDGERRFDFIYTHDRSTVINAARCFIQDHAGSGSAPSRRDLAGSSPVEISAAPAPASSTGSTRALALTARDASSSPGPPTDPPAPGGFREVCRLALDFLNAVMPLGLWMITRVENGRQTYLYVDDNEYGLSVGGSHPWQSSYCVHMVAGTGPRIAPDAQAIAVYAAAPVNATTQIAAYAGAPIAEPDGSLFGAICGLDRDRRADLAPFGPVLDLLAGVLTLALAGDRALAAAERASRTSHTSATTDALTGIHNRRAWDDALSRLEVDYTTRADPTVIVVVDLDNLKQVNDGPGGHREGDDLLRRAAQTMRAHIRDRDLLSRIGGDEFGLILAGCDAALAPTLVRRLTAALDAAAIPASAGWAALHPAATVLQVVDLADQAMFDTKQTRRRAAVGAR